MRSTWPSASRRDEWLGAWWTVRTVPGVNATKPYRCPGCAQVIPVGTPHVVVWPELDLDAGDRRHWHQSCWVARERRGAR
jgi:hypothetical protein